MEAGQTQKGTEETVALGGNAAVGLGSFGYNRKNTRAADCAPQRTGSHKNKVDVLRERNIGCFVDDRLETCDLIHEAGILPILYKQPWNRVAHPYREINSWKELEALIDF